MTCCLQKIIFRGGKKNQEDQAVKEDESPEGLGARQKSSTAMASAGSSTALQGIDHQKSYKVLRQHAAQLVGNHLGTASFIVRMFK